MKTKSISLLLLSTNVLGVGATQCGSPKEPKPQMSPKPNVIYILADDLGYGDIEPYGQRKIRTPHLSRMAKEGMVFSQHYAGCTVSAPSRGSLMTGMHTGHAQIRGNREVEPEGQQPMRPGTYTLGTMMKAGGYTTGIFGKWGLGYPGSGSTPVDMGFDRFYGYNCQRQAHSYYPEHLWSNDRKVVLEENLNQGRKIYSQQLIHEEALAFIRSNRDTSFFAMLTYTLPHAELNLPHDSIYRSYEYEFDETPYDGRYGYHPVEKPRASFAAMVTTLDHYVGEILAELKKLGIDDRTMVMFTSDNGPHREGGADPVFFNSSGELRGIKRDLYEGGIRVPFIVRYPGVVEAGTRAGHQCAFWDVMPTLAELARVEVAEEIDGISFWPTLVSQDEQKEHAFLYWEFHEGGGKRAIRQGDWKLVVLHVDNPEKRKVELYNLSTDIGERENVAERYPEVVERMLLLGES